MRVDLFFEMTGQLTAEQFTYTIVLVPCKLSYKTQVMFRPVPHITCDWRGTLTQHLSQGWKLVDIYLDIPTVSQVSGLGFFVLHCPMRETWITYLGKAQQLQEQRYSLLLVCTVFSRV